MTTYREIFLRAVEKVHDIKSGCCCAIFTANNPGSVGTNICLEAFSKAFKPENSITFWWGYGDTESRILALLFMAEIAGQPGGIDEQLGLI